MTLDPTEDPLYGVTQIAKMFSVEPYTVRVWIKEGKLQGRMIQGRWRVPKSEVIRLANEEHG
jgi:excisionase family DNA binding protein